VNRYGPDPKEAAAIAKRSGCKIARSEQLHDGSWAHRIICSSHRHKVRFLANLAEYDSRLPDIRRLAERVTAGAKDTRAQAAALQRFVQQAVTFTPEAVETFSPTWRTLEHGLGDCDDSSRALLAMMRSLGMPAALRTIPELGDTRAPRHVAPVLRHGSDWIWLEPSIAAHFGEHPQRAARRLRSARADLGGRADLAAVSPEEGISIGLTPEQSTLFGGAALSVFASLAAPSIAPAALAIGGAAAGYGATAFPLVRDFETADGRPCSTWLPGVEEGSEHAAACERAFGRLRARNAAIGAVAGGLAGLIVSRWTA
jgi:hypothetical protein